MSAALTAMSERRAQGTPEPPSPERSRVSIRLHSLIPTLESLSKLHFARMINEDEHNDRDEGDVYRSNVRRTRRRAASASEELLHVGPL